MYGGYLGRPKPEGTDMNTSIAKTLLMTLLIGTTALAGCLGADDTEDEPELEQLVIAFNLKDDYTNVDENPQRFADYMSETLNMDVSLYPIDSEGAALQALRFGNADIAFMDGGAAWVGWQQYGLDAIAADQKSDGRTYYSAHAVVLKDSEMAAAHLDDDPSTDPFSLLAEIATFHPLLANLIARAFPIPVLPPVIQIVFLLIIS